MRSIRTLGTVMLATAAAVAMAVTTLAAPADASGHAGASSSGAGEPGVNQLGMSPAMFSPAAIIRSNEQTAFNYFVNKGMTKIRAAGIIGNLDQESGMDPTIHQIGGGPGRGIAQWSVGGRWDTYASDNVQWYANKEGKSATSLGLQLDFIWYELHTFSYYGFSQLHQATTIDQAVIAFQNGYEGCGTCNTAARESYAHDAYNRYA
jgi:Phage tail lysozyme